MAIDPGFRAASEAAEEWVTKVGLVAWHAGRGEVDMAYRCLLPSAPRHDEQGEPLKRPDKSLQGSLLAHAECVERALPELTALSVRVGGPVEYPPGGVCSSGHEWSLNLARSAHFMLTLSLGDMTDPAEHYAQGEWLLCSFAHNFVIEDMDGARVKERIRREREMLLCRTAGTAPDMLDSPREGPRSTITQAQPKTPLSGWHAITAAVNWPHARLREIKSLNARFNGPIVSPGKGKHPFVYREDLLAWWDKMYIHAQEQANRSEGARYSAEAQHNYGREGTAHPGVGGGEKKRRRDRRA